MRFNVLIGTLGGLVCIGFVGWRVHGIHSRAVSQIGIIEDRSASHPGWCSSLQSITEHILEEHTASSASWLTFLATGDESTANEPKLLARYPLPADRRIMEGPKTGLRWRKEILDDLKLQCGKLQPTMTSPIFQGVTQGIAELHRLGCGNGSACKLWIDSDLEENAVAAIKTALEHPGYNRQALPTPLDNEGIQVAFCGFAVTAGRIVGPSGREILKTRPRSPGHDDNLRRTWSQLFTKHALVTFEPYCPGPRTSSELR